MALETELKLGFSSKNASKIKLSPILHNKAPDKQSHLVGTYFDTAKQELRDLKVGLRVREEDGKLIQAMKTAGSSSAGLHQRQEWEAEVKEKFPEFDKLPAEGQALLSDEIRAALQAVFTSDFQRQSWFVDYRDSHIEICLDQGKVHNKHKSQPIHELELELKSGNSADLYQLGLEFLQQAPLWIENASKAQRGYALETPFEVISSKAEKIQLDENIDAASAFVQILQHQLAHFQANDAVTRLAKDIEGVHQMRVALRRIRALLSLYKKNLTKAEVQQLKQDIAWLNGLLAPARDWDVIAESIEHLSKLMQQSDSKKPLLSVQKAIQQKQRKSYKQLHKAMNSSRYTAMLLRSSAWLETFSQQHSDSPLLQSKAQDFALSGLKQLHQDFISNSTELWQQSPEQRHKSRINSKKLAYTALLFQSLFDDTEISVYLHHLSNLRDDLGLLNDIHVVRQLLPQLNPSMNAWRLIQGWYAAQEFQALQQLTKHHADFISQSLFWQD